MPSFSSLLLTSASLASLALAKTDLEGCTSSTVIKYGGASVLYYVPGTGEICDFLDCGGGRAPPKTTVPGCAAYEGTATYSPSYLPGYGGMAANTGMSSAAAASSTAASESSESSVDTSLPPGPRITSGSYLSLTPAGGLSVVTTLSTTPPYLQASSYASSSYSSYTYISGSSQPPSSSMAASSSSSSFAAAPSGTDSGSSGSGSGSSGSSSGTVSSGSSSSSTEPSVAASTGGAAKLWAGSAGLLALGGLVAAL